MFLGSVAPASFLGVTRYGRREHVCSVALDDEEVRIDVTPSTATYLLFLHALEDHERELPAGMADLCGEVKACGGYQRIAIRRRVSEYRLELADGSEASVPIHRPVEIQR